MITIEQRQLLRRRQDHLAEWVLGAGAAVRQLAELLDIRPAESLAEHPPIGLPTLERLLRAERVEEWTADERRWWWTQLLAFVGQLLISEHGGRWLVASDSDSPSFGRYVVGDMRRGADPSAIIDPAAIVEELLTQPLGRSLVALIDSAEAQSLAGPGRHPIG